MPRILLVDDDEPSRNLVAKMLEKLSFDYDTAENGREALDAVAAAGESDGYSAVLMDVQMPVLDGLDAVRSLRESGCRLPVIAITAHALAGDREKCLRAGMNDYLSKPLSLSHLRDALARWVPAGD